MKLCRLIESGLPSRFGFQAQHRLTTKSKTGTFRFLTGSAGVKPVSHVFKQTVGEVHGRAQCQRRTVSCVLPNAGSDYDFSGSKRCCYSVLSNIASDSTSMYDVCFSDEDALKNELRKPKSDVRITNETLLEDLLRFDTSSTVPRWWDDESTTPLAVMTSEEQTSPLNDPYLSLLDTSNVQSGSRVGTEYSRNHAAGSDVPPSLPNGIVTPTSVNTNCKSSRRLTDRERSVVMRKVLCVVDYAQCRKQATSNAENVKHDAVSASSSQGAATSAKSFINRALEIMKAENAKQCSSIQDRMISERNAFMYINLARCRSALEQHIYFAIVDTGDLMPAFDRIPEFTRVLLSPASAQLPDSALNPLFALIHNALKPHCVTLSKLNNQSEDYSKKTCSQCGADINFWDSPVHGICETCGAVVEECYLDNGAADVLADDLFQTGRQFVEQLGAYHHFSVSKQSRHRLKVYFATAFYSAKFHSLFLAGRLVGFSSVYLSKVRGYLRVSRCRYRTCRSSVCVFWAYGPGSRSHSSLLFSCFAQGGRPCNYSTNSSTFERF